MKRMARGGVLLAALVGAWCLIPVGSGGLAQSGNGMKTPLLKEIQKAEAPREDMQNGAGNTNAAPPPKPLFNGPEISIKGDPVMGNPNAKVTLVEFADYQCPFCGHAFHHVYLPMVEQYVKTGKVRYVIHDFPLTQIHSHAFKAAEAARCAGDQGKYWEMHDRLFENQKALDEKGLVAAAQALGLDMDEFQQCLDSGKYKSEIEREIQSGIKLGVRGTPFFFIGPSGNDPDKFTATSEIDGAYPYGTFKKAIEDALSAAGENP